MTQLATRMPSHDRSRYLTLMDGRRLFRIEKREQGERECSVKETMQADDKVAQLLSARTVSQSVDHLHLAMDEIIKHDYVE